MTRIAADAAGDAEGGSLPVTGLSFAGLTAFTGKAVISDRPDVCPGCRLGDVTIVRLIGEGGMGRVFEGLQGVPCRTVAVKLIRPGVLSPAATRRFEHEAHILGRLSHPGIARIYSVGLQEVDGRQSPYLVMEYVEEALPITLAAARRNLSTRDRVTLFRDACRAVGHGHQKGVIHRDLKPGNMLVDAAGQPKVIDFGVARTTDRDIALTTMHTDVGQLVGTLAYMAPEQFDNASDDLDIRVDVYSLGVVLYELLTESMPYDVCRRPVYDVARIVRDVEPRQLSASNPRLRGDLSTIVSKCLEKERGRRYSSAMDLEADLSRYLRGEPIAASPPSLVAAVVRLARRHRLAAAAAAAVAAALLLAVVGVSVFAVQADRQRAIADAARRRAVQESAAADAGRATAERERARADAEATLARRRLYVANLRALKSCLDTRNLRMARELFADSVPLVGDPMPLELRCVAAGLDDALAAHDSGVGPVTGIAYSPDASMVAATAVPKPSTALNTGMAFIHGRYRGVLSDRSTGAPNIASRMLFAAEGDHHLRPSDIPSDPRSLPAAIRFLWRAADDAFMNHGERSVPLEVSPDGRRMAVHSAVGTVHVVDRLTGASVSMLDGHRGRISHATFSPDGGRLVTRSGWGAATLWQCDTGRLVGRYPTDARPVEAVEFSPNGGRLAVLLAREHTTQEVLFVDARDGHHISTVSVGLGPPPIESTIMKFDPDGSRLVTAFQAQDAAIWDVATAVPVATLRGHASVISAVAFSPDGRVIATGATNGHIRLWSAETLACEQVMMGHTATVLALAFSPTGRAVASGSQDGSLRVWPGTATRPLSELPGLNGLSAAVFSPDGRHLAVAARDGGGIELWNAHAVVRERILIADGGPVAEIAYSPDGSLVAAAFESVAPVRGVRVWRSDTGEQIGEFVDHARGAFTVAFSADGSRLLTTSGDGMAMVWDIRTGRRLMAHSAGSRAIHARTHAAFGLGGARVASNSRQILDSETGDVAVELPPLGQVTALAPSPDGRLLAIGGAMGTVSLNEVTTGHRLWRGSGHSAAVRSLAFSADGRLMVTGGEDGACRSWDCGSGTALQVFVGHEGAVQSVVFTPDGRRLVSSATDGTVRIWDAESAEELLVIPGQRDAPRAIALSADGTRLLTSTADGRPRIWGVSNRQIADARHRATSDGDTTADLSGNSRTDGIIEVGQGRGPQPVPGFLEGSEEGGEVGQILSVQSQRLQQR